MPVFAVAMTSIGAGRVWWFCRVWFGWCVHNPALSSIPQCALQKDGHAAQAENNRDVLTLPGHAVEKHTQRGKNSVVKKNALYTRSQPDRTAPTQRPKHMLNRKKLEKS